MLVNRTRKCHIEPRYIIVWIFGSVQCSAKQGENIAETSRESRVREDNSRVDQSFTLGTQ